MAGFKWNFGLKPTWRKAITFMVIIMAVVFPTAGEETGYSLETSGRVTKWQRYLWGDFKSSPGDGSVCEWEVFRDAEHHKEDWLEPGPIWHIGGPNVFKITCRFSPMEHYLCTYYAEIGNCKDFNGEIIVEYFEKLAARTMMGKTVACAYPVLTSMRPCRKITWWKRNIDTDAIHADISIFDKNRIMDEL